MNRARVTLTLLTILAAANASDLWTIDIDLSPAPAPEDGPPFSANAIRDPRLLPYQITGIAGSYACTILLIGILLMTVGRPSRLRAQELARSDNSTEMVRPLGVTFDPSPISPQSQRSWYSGRRLRGKKSAAESIKSLGSVISPGAESITSFDVGIMEADRLKRADEMERLYAAVMAQDQRRGQQPPPPEYTRQPLRITTAPHLAHLQPSSLRSPRSPVRAIYPPGSMPPLPTSPLSPVHMHYNRQRPNSDDSESGSSNKRIRKSIKHLKISAPIMRNDDNDDGARTPLSPRVYTNPGIPPDLPTARTVDTFESAQYAPTTPATTRSMAWEEREPQEMDEVREMPSSRLQKAAKRSHSSQTNFSQPLRIDVERVHSPAAASVNNTLPFRQLHWNVPASPYYPYQGQGPFSAGPIKTTFVESSRDKLGVGTPMTGMATPYSAYMPFTPITPVAAHLSTRAERRQRERDERTIHGAITEEDQVADDKELWDDAY